MSMAETNSIELKKEPRTIVGTVISDKMDKTIVVQIERKVKHPLYGKYVRRYSKMYAHDEENACKIGDLVMIQHSRPLSKTKRWKLVEVVKRKEQQ
ncbi:MAG: 30S ribosomal protein S17 [Gammaproteobacteria bacterium RIFCSPHIGHO2_12_FULL_43_28]|nr:MAG: 30S ribosomal protein S17 [Gammaproteobacteria bacterium RIFCSPHIGHO2_12_FULL_43_28]